MVCLTPDAKVLARISRTKNHREEHLNKISDVISQLKRSVALIVYIEN